MSMRVLIVVTHLLGAGHLTRAAALARAFAGEGHDVTLVSGGSPAPLVGLEGITFVQLPPVHIRGTDFKTLLDEAGEPIADARREERRKTLFQALKTTKPDILITELFPFGRRVLADEFAALVDEARRMTPRPRILCSIRDILVAPSRLQRIEETHAHLLRSYDAVLVHGDPQLVPLEASWPMDPRIRPLIRYTGYVDENESPVSEGLRHGIVVSGGSSAASLPLYRAAIAAAHAIADRPWRILIGRGVGAEDFLSLQQQAPAHVTVERARPDFRTLLAHAELSVSQAGYNTAVDLLRTGARAVLVPFEAGHETEQRLRAERLKEIGLAEIVPEHDLSPRHLAEAIRRVLAQPPLPRPGLSLDGARQSVAVAGSLTLGAPSLHRRIDWTPLGQALARASDQGCPVSFWWRDDDAVAETPELDRLLGLARRYEAGIALASIPRKLDPSLALRLSNEDLAFAMVHGWSHANHAPPHTKKAEFGPHRPLQAMTAEAGQALHQARELLGAKLLPVFVPPWNRLAPDLVPLLPSLGFKALSTFRDRQAAHPVPGLVQINTHIDPIDWHGTHSLLESSALVAGMARAVESRVTGTADRGEPIGLLTHHLVHDEAIWSFCEAMLDYFITRDIRLLRADRLFRGENRIAVTT